MAAEARCSACKHRGVRSICTEPLSPRHGQRVEPNDSCPHFLENPAKDLYVKGLVAGMSEDEASAAITYLEQAIDIGLPLDDEMHAHYQLGGAYQIRAARAGLAPAQLVHSADFARASAEMERAIQIDREQAFGYFVDPLGRALLGRFDLLCSLESDILAKEGGRDAAIAYLEGKLALCGHLSTPLLGTLLALGNLHAEAGAKNKAAACFGWILRAEPVDRTDEAGIEATVRRIAAKNLAVVTGQAAPGGAAGTGCLIVLSVLGLAFLAACAGWAWP